mgnify:CR=1 FL=1
MVVTNSALKFNLLSILLLQFSHIYLFERFIGHLDDALFPIDGFSHFPECFVEFLNRIISSQFSGLFNDIFRIEAGFLF